jgi:hypothetical protein
MYIHIRVYMRIYIYSAGLHVLILVDVFRRFQVAAEFPWPLRWLKRVAWPDWGNWEQKWDDNGGMIHHGISGGTLFSHKPMYQ